MANGRVGFRGASGFTLLEMLVVLVIISLVSALVIPRMLASLPGVQLKSSARAVAASLRYARSNAVSQTTPHVAIFDNDRKRLTIEPFVTSPGSADAAGDGEIGSASESRGVYEFPDGIEFDFVIQQPVHDGGGPNSIQFFPRGDSTGGKLVLRNARQKEYRITVDRITGTVDIDRP